MDMQSLTECSAGTLERSTRRLEAHALLALTGRGKRILEP